MYINWSQGVRAEAARSPGKTDASDLIYGASELPKGPAGRGNVYMAWGYSASRKTRQPEEAWSLIEFLTKGEDAMDTPLPARVALKESEYLPKGAEVAVGYDALAYSVPYYLGGHFRAVEQALAEAIWGIMGGWVTAKDAAAQAARDIARIGR